jgi:hypothetical protein
MANQRLDYNHLAEVLNEKGLADPATLQHILEQSVGVGELFPEVLVRESLVADWELSRVTCEAFHLVFLSVDFYEPSPAAVELIDPILMHQHCIVPFDVYDDLLTVAMPALTPSEVLKALGEKLGKKVQPVVGTVSSNRRWLIEHVPMDPVLPADGDWSAVFDEGDAAVLMELEGTEPDPIETQDTTSGLEDLLS